MGPITFEDIMTRIKVVICEHYGISAEKYETIAMKRDPDLVEDFDSDPQDKLSLIMKVEEEFSVDISEAAMNEMHTAAELGRAVQDLMYPDGINEEATVLETPVDPSAEEAATATEAISETVPVDPAAEVVSETLPEPPAEIAIPEGQEPDYADQPADGPKYPEKAPDAVPASTESGTCVNP